MPSFSLSLSFNVIDRAIDRQIVFPPLKSSLSLSTPLHRSKKPNQECPHKSRRTPMTTTTTPPHRFRRRLLHRLPRRRRQRYTEERSSSNRRPISSGRSSPKKKTVRILPRRRFHLYDLVFYPSHTLDFVVQIQKTSSAAAAATRTSTSPFLLRFGFVVESLSWTFMHAICMLLCLLARSDVLDGDSSSRRGCVCRIIRLLVLGRVVVGPQPAFIEDEY